MDLMDKYLFYVPINRRDGTVGKLHVYQGDMDRLNRYIDQDGRWIGYVNGQGYGWFSLSGTSISAHRMIWQSRNPNLPVPNGFEIDHINHDILDNSVTNLRCTPKRENVRNVSATGYESRVAHNRISCGEKSAVHKLTDAQCNGIRAAYVPGIVSQRTVAEMFGCSQGQVSNIIRGINRKVGVS